MSRFPALVTFLALLLVGCATPGSDAPVDAPPSDAPAPNASTGAPSVMPWNLLNCAFVYGTTLVPSALLAERMPEGFQTVVAAGAGPGTLAQLGFEIDVCAEGSGIDRQIAPMSYASTWTPASAPGDLAVQGVSMFVNWDVLVPDDERRALMQAAGTPAHAGDIVVSADLRAGMPTAPFRVDYSFEDAGAFRFDIVPGSGPTNAGAGAGEFAQYTPGEDGSLTFWRTKWAVGTGGVGTGTITLDPASWQAQLFGATIIPAAFTYGSWDYTEGMIALPPAP